MKINIINRRTKSGVIGGIIRRIFMGAFGGGAASLGVVLSLLSNHEYASGVSAFLYSMLGGIIGGIVMLTPLSSIIFGAFMGHYVRQVAQGFDLNQAMAFSFLIMVLIIVLRCFSVFVDRKMGVDLYKESNIMALSTAVFCYVLFEFMHYIFLPSLWGKLIFNITNGS